ncbi:acetolactate synthase I/II/III large subunit [Exophiala aquamarina CBS 119918]|uniref:acetolactate synthase n=1 Tax=Exophiala aquamarina CBS 119918 TaxID=1182545 RepID=A0A072P996_9EURO|nr:acetolactate synthase I/II/III large subunit [Exophiala aquamarina CBS 119918]KEF56446.1 acetolactate synthase I/II/III large subunit [Exophiala aquamarina CBS 119918]
MEAQHEQGAGHMAEGYFRATGKPGVAFVAAGAGLTSIVTPMQDALCDGTAIVVICGHTPKRARLDQDPLVEVTEITKGCSKWNVIVQDINDLPQRIHEAFAIATSGRPGPVLIEIPQRLNSQLLTRPRRISNTFKTRINPSGGAARIQPDRLFHDTLQRVARLVNGAKKPILYCGQGMSGNPEGVAILQEFADKAQIPVTTTLQGLGAFDEHDPKALHMVGLHGAAYANLAIQEADLILAMGARFDDRVTGNIAKFAPNALSAAQEGRGGIIQFDIAPKNINKVVSVTESLQGDCSENLSLLMPLVNPVSSRPEWMAQIQMWKSKYPLTGYSSTPTEPVPSLIRAQEVIERLSNIVEPIKDRTVIATGVGQHQMWAAQHFRWRHPRTMITSGGLGTMGYGLPAAIGAKIARPEALVIDIDGDASFNMSIAELLTASAYNIGVKVLLFNNEQMGMVSDLQRLYYQSRFAQNRQGNPDFVLASEAYGVSSRRCVSPGDIDEMLNWLVHTDGPALLEVITEQNSPVWPVVPAGKGLHEFITYPEAHS